MKRFGHCGMELFLITILLALLGRTVYSSQKLAVGGRFVPENDGNWHVAVIYRRNLICSGSMLRNNIVLTAATCVKGLELSDITIRAASKTFKRGGQTRKILKTVYHPQYREENHAYNIALMELVRPLKNAAANFTTVNLPNADPADIPSSVFIYGWGISSLAAKGALSKQLKVSRLKVYSDEKCEGYLTDLDQNQMQNIFCVGDRAKQVDICIDDIGGPVMNRNDVQYGVISSGGACSNDNTMIVSNVVSHLTWLQSVLREWNEQSGL